MVVLLLGIIRGLLNLALARCPMLPSFSQGPATVG